jgi:hypothetical protein
LGAVVGYLVFIAGTLLAIQLARTPRSHTENPALVFLIVWVVAGITHGLVRKFWRACAIAALGSILVYTVLVLTMKAANEMLVSGMILVGLLGFAFSIVMGIPVLLYRRGFRDPGA